MSLKKTVLKRSLLHTYMRKSASCKASFLYTVLPRAAELETMSNQEESDVLNPEWEVPEKRTGHSQDTGQSC